MRLNLLVCEKIFMESKYMNYQINLWFPIFDINKLEILNLLKDENIPMKK